MYSGATIVSNFVAGWIMLTSNPLSLFLALLANILSFFCTWSTSRKRFTSVQTNQTVATAARAVTPSAPSGDTTALEATPLLQARNNST
ncbi:hypothetical protein Micbo1qcDRAFT_166174, partial [Microdochium bolleyi]